MSQQSVSSNIQQMISFRPLRAWRYDLAKIDFQSVIAPPYDVISAQRQEQLYQKSPHNCIRLILNKPEDGDKEGANRYTRARDFYQTWKKEGVLRQDESPAFYLYQQSFKDLVTGEAKSRMALIGCLRLEPFEKGVVIPHEKTLDKPKKDRRALMEATHAIFEPIFGLYEKAGDLTRLNQELSGRKPVNDVVDDDGVHHRLWIIDDEASIAKIQNTLQSQKIYIADGHHRYTTALQYGLDQRKAKGTGENGDLPTDYMMMALVNFYDEGLALYPTHRLLSAALKVDSEKVLNVLQDYFEVQEMDVSALQKTLESGTNPDIQFGFLSPEGQSYLLTLKDMAKAKQAMPQGKPEVWYQLDVNVLGYLIFGKAFGLAETDWEAHLQFTHDNQEAHEAIPKGKASNVFLLKAPRVKVLQDMCEANELMPQKSTYFYPKMGSGFMFYQHSEGE